VAAFGGIDICVNNASAISLTQTEETDMKKFDLMHGINARGTNTHIHLSPCLSSSSPLVLGSESKSGAVCVLFVSAGTFLVSKYCIPYLKKSKNGMILNISPVCFQLLLCSFFRRSSLVLIVLCDVCGCDVM